MKITFVLPARGPAGGIRVTMRMANMLLESGHDVRIVWGCPPLLSKQRFLQTSRSFVHRISGYEENDWLKYFKGKTQSFRDLHRIDFVKGERK